MVTITAFGEGKCVWCLERTDGVHTQFKDGLTGFLCRKHFWQALHMRADHSSAEGGASKIAASPRSDLASLSRASGGNAFHSEGKE